MNKENKKYLIIAEIIDRGYVLGYVHTLEVAETILKNVFAYSDWYSFCDMYRVAEHLKFSVSYKMNGNYLFMTPPHGNCNGALSVYRIEIDLDTFSLSSFIRERENISEVFSDELYRDQIDRMFELFPWFCWFAN